MKRLLMLLVALCFVWLAGCTFVVTAQTPDGFEAPCATDAHTTQMNDASMSNVPDQEAGADTALFPVDAMTTDVVSDHMMPESDAMSLPSSTDIRVLAVSSSRCRDGNMSLPAEFTDPNLDVWHVCYTSPEGMRTSTGFVGRPEAVTFTVTSALTQPAAREMLATVTAPVTANPWIASVVIALPRGRALPPLFNVSLRMPDMTTESFAVYSNAYGNGLQPQGFFRFWHVDASGRKERREYQLLSHQCLPIGARFPGLEGDALPQGVVCPASLQACGPGMFHCP